MNVFRSLWPKPVKLCTLKMSFDRASEKTPHCSWELASTHSEISRLSWTIFNSRQFLASIFVDESSRDILINIKGLRVTAVVFVLTGRCMLIMTTTITIMQVTPLGI